MVARSSTGRGAPGVSVGRCFAVLMAVAVWTLSSPACSSSTTNEAGGGASGAAGAGALSCADAGTDCGACCAAGVGPVTMELFDVMMQKCACDADPPIVCDAECGDYCTNQNLSVKCVGCLLGLGGLCVSNQCYSAGCKQVVACLETCK